MVGEIQFYLCAHMHDALSLGQVAKDFHFSESYFCALFKRETGVSVMHFLQWIRIHYAVYLMRDDERTLRDISEQVGFSNYSYFGKLFKKYVGITPESYREALRQKRPPHAGGL